MATISSIGNNSRWAQLQTVRENQQAKRQERLFEKIDADKSGSVDSNELQTLLDKVKEKTGISLDSNAADLLNQSDNDKSGALSSNELSKLAQNLLPAPTTTQEFVQFHNAGKQPSKPDDSELFSKIDTDGSGSINSSELQSMLDNAPNIKGQQPSNPPSASELLSKLDSDSDGALSLTEFQAGRPDNDKDKQQGEGQTTAAASSGMGGPGGMGGPNGAGGPPPAGGPGGMGGVGKADSTKSSTSATDSTYDPLDTNKDGVVSQAERAAGEFTQALNSMTRAINGNANGSVSEAEVKTSAEKQAEEFSKIAKADFKQAKGSLIDTSA